MITLTDHTCFAGCQHHPFADGILRPGQPLRLSLTLCSRGAMLVSPTPEARTVIRECMAEALERAH